MKKMESFLSGLAVEAEHHQMIAFTGGGGKTGLIWQLTEELIRLKKRVVVSTTVHMAFEPLRPVSLMGEGAEALLNAHGYVLAASIDERKGKYGPLPSEKLQELYQICDVLLVEADGARKKPLKIPMEWEPVIPEAADRVIAVTGLDSLYRSIEEVSYCPDELGEFLKKKKTDLVLPQDLVQILSDRKGLRKGVEDRKYMVYLNKMDSSKGTACEIEDIAGRLAVRGIDSCWGSLKEKTIYKGDIS